MYCKNFWKKSIPFFLAFSLGILAASLFYFDEIPLNSLEKKVAPPFDVQKTTVGQNSGRGSGSHSIRNDGIQFLSKPAPEYTQEARVNSVEGKVLLRVTFLANGQIGSVIPVKELSHGLTEQAVEAAKKIKFEPAMRNGRPVSVTKSVQYTFTIY